MPALSKTNVINATLVMIAVGINIACVWYSKQYPAPCAIASGMIVAFTTILRLPVPQVPVPPVAAARRQSPWGAPIVAPVTEPNASEAVADAPHVVVSSKPRAVRVETQTGDV